MQARRIQAFGFSLLEVVLGLALSALLIMSLIKLMLNFEAGYRLQQAWLKLHQEAFFLSSYLSPRVARSGFSFCTDKDSVKKMFAVRGYDFTELPSFITEKEKVRGELLVIALCDRYEGRVQFKQFAYYVAETNRRNKQGNFIRAFYEKPLGGNRVELEEGVQSFRLDYALKSEDGHLDYYPAAKIADWNKVVAVNLNFVLASLESVISVPKKQLLLKPWSIYVYLRQSS